MRVKSTRFALKPMHYFFFFCGARSDPRKFGQDIPRPHAPNSNCIRCILLPSLLTCGSAQGTNAAMSLRPVYDHHSLRVRARSGPVHQPANAVLGSGYSVLELTHKKSSQQTRTAGWRSPINFTSGTWHMARRTRRTLQPSFLTVHKRWGMDTKLCNIQCVQIAQCNHAKKDLHGPSRVRWSRIVFCALLESMHSTRSYWWILFCPQYMPILHGRLLL